MSMRDNLSFWQPTWAALTAILDVLPPGIRANAEEQLRLMAQVAEDNGDERARNFCLALAGEEVPKPKPKPKLVIDNS